MLAEAQSVQIKNDIIQLLSHNFGEPTAITFRDFNEEETLSIFISSAYELLKELIGERKAHEQIDGILSGSHLNIQYD